MKTELHKLPQGDSFMTPENHTLFDWKTLDEFSDLNRLEMVFTSLPAVGAGYTLSHAQWRRAK